MCSYRIAPSFLIFILCLTVGWAQSAPDLFDEEALLQLSLTFDLKKLQENREVDPDYQKCYLEFLTDEGDTARMKVQIKARGNFRRTDGTCKLPPLRVRLSKHDTLGPFYGDTKLKLVTLCQKEYYVLREYMVYKLYQELSPYSLRVRLCEITYIDDEGNYDPLTAYGFFIEDLEHFGRRMEAPEIDTAYFPLDGMDRETLTRVHMFQYMVGNPDHHPDRLQNTKLVQPLSGGLPIPVPYDFDWSGMVDAGYTKMEGFTGGLFTKRSFVPLCRSLDEFMAVGDIFRSKRAAMEALIREDAFLAKTDKNYMLDYMDEFFDTIKKKGKVKKLFVDSCPD